MDKTNVSFSAHINGIGMAPKHYGVVYHVCRQVSARHLYVTYRLEDKLMRGFPLLSLHRHIIAI
jgi:hypothetical protein